MAAELHLPAGFRFHPTDEELVMHYLCRRCTSQRISVPIIAELDLYKYDPWDLPGLALYGEKEWYFFSPRDRKYPNGSRPNRAAGSGYWKATGADKPIKPTGHQKPVGIKKALVFYAGKAPRGEKTNWIMHEYRLADVDRSARNKSHSLRLDDWVLCRIYNKKGTLEKRNVVAAKPPESLEQKPEIPTTHGLAPPPSISPASGVYHDLVYFDTSDSVPRPHTDSSCSEHVLSPDITCDREVQSEPTDWWRNALDFPFHYVDATVDSALASQFQIHPMSPSQDMFMYVQKPF